MNFSHQAIVVRESSFRSRLHRNSYFFFCLLQIAEDERKRDRPRQLHKIIIIFHWGP